MVSSSTPLAEYDTGTKEIAADRGEAEEPKGLPLKEPTSVAVPVIAGLLLLLGFIAAAVRYYNRYHSRGRAEYLPKMNHEFGFESF